ADPAQGGGHVRAVAAGVHPHGSTDRAGDPHGPLEAGEPGGRRAPGDDGQRGCGAGSDGGAVDLDVEEAAGERDRQPGEAVVVDEQVGALAHHEHVDAGLAHGAGHRGHVVVVRDRGEQRRRAPHPVGGAGPEWLVPPGPLAEQLGGPLDDLAGAHRSGPPSAASRRSGSSVRSPAPRVRQTSPGRRVPRSEEAASSWSGIDATSAHGWASRTASTTSLPETPGRGGSPAGYTSVTTRRSASTKAWANVAPSAAVRL